MVSRNRTQLTDNFIRTHARARVYLSIESLRLFTYAPLILERAIHSLFLGVMVGERGMRANVFNTSLFKTVTAGGVYEVSCDMEI